MLISLKHKQQRIASVTLSIFLGSWLLMFCQMCLADTENSKQHSESEVCHTITSDLVSADVDTSVVNDDLCLGVCDCDAITITMNSEKNSESKEKIKFSLDLSAHVTPEFTLSSRSPPAYQISPLPERALSLPFQRYTVLLI